MEEVEEVEEVLLLQGVGRVGVSPCSSSTLAHSLAHLLDHFRKPHEEASLEKSGEEGYKKIFGFVLAVFRVF